MPVPEPNGPLGHRLQESISTGTLVALGEDADAEAHSGFGWTTHVWSFGVVLLADWAGSNILGIFQYT